MTDMDLETALRERLAQIDQLADAASAARRPVELDQASVGRLSRMDAIQGQAMALEAERRRQAERHRILAALERLAAGAYGDCITCGEPIPEKRLALDPTIATCVRCASRS